MPQPVFYVKSDPRLPGPKTGAQRMRAFRQRHPDFDRKRHARQRAHLKAFMAAFKAERAAAFERERERALSKPVLMLPAPAVRLCLPAPVLDPTIAAINALAMKRNRECVAA